MLFARYLTLAFLLGGALVLGLGFGSFSRIRRHTRALLALSAVSLAVAELMPALPADITFIAIGILSGMLAIWKERPKFRDR
jgi:hypothetical protein